MKTALTLLAVGLLASAVHAQGVITRISDGTTHFYYGNDLDQVFADISPNGNDTIIIPGGQFLASADLYIYWPVVIIGTGFRADSALAYGGQTEIIGTQYTNLRIMENADGTELHGLSFVNAVWGGVLFGSSIATSGADNVKFVRCNIPDLGLGYDQYGSNAHNALVQECIVGYLYVDQGHEPLVRSSFISAINYCPAASNAVFENCVFLNYDFNGYDIADFRNNIFLRNMTTPLTISQVGSTYENNLFVGASGGFSVTFNGPAESGTNVTSNLSTGADRAFESGVTSFTTYEPLADYHAGPMWQTSGVDGSQLGIFGGSLPWKEGSLPFNPHWSGLSSSGSTTNGTLQNIQISGSAQTH